MNIVHVYSNNSNADSVGFGRYLAMVLHATDFYDYISPMSIEKVP